MSSTERLDVLRERNKDLLIQLRHQTERLQKLMRSNGTPERDQTRETAPERDKTREPAPERDQTRGSAPERDKTRGSAPERDKTRGSAPERDKTRGSAPERDKTRGSAPERDKTRGSAPERDKTRGSAPERNKTREPAQERDKTRGSAPERDKTRGSAPQRDKTRDTAQKSPSHGRRGSVVENDSVASDVNTTRLSLQNDLNLNQAEVLVTLIDPNRGPARAALSKPTVCFQERETATARSETERETATARSETERETATARSETERETAPARSETERETATARSETERETATARSETERETAPARSETERETATARSETERETATARSETERESATARSETERETATARSETERETATAWSETERETATARSETERETATARSEKETRAPSESADETGESMAATTQVKTSMPSLMTQPGHAGDRPVYPGLLRDGGNRRPTGLVRSLLSRRPSAGASLSTREKERGEAVRVTVQPPGQELGSASDRHRLQPLLGYDWIAGLLDVESSLMERSEEFFSDLRTFRQVNREECVHSQHDGLPEEDAPPLQLTEEEDPRDPMDTHECTFCYRINRRLFATPLDPQECCPVCKMPKTSHPHSAAEPALIRVSLPRSTLLPAYQHKAHRRCSFDPSDSVGLPSHCLSGWSNPAPSSVSQASSLDLRSTLNTAPPSGLASAQPQPMEQLEGVSVSRVSGSTRSDQLMNVSRLARYRFQRLPPNSRPRGPAYPVF